MNLATFHEMLTYKRPDNSQSERDFIGRYLEPLGVTPDKFGNLHKRVGFGAKLLFSSHTDTVHREDGAQTIELDSNGWIYAKASNCLGADCTAGVWLMVEMIKRNVPGYYIFHRAEESGGMGSYWLSKNRKKKLGKFRAAIAFDRCDFSSVITHQSGERCCSDSFADSLASQLEFPGAKPTWEKDDSGTFTDSANYTGLIGECTNISVGYQSQHTKDERQYGPFLPHLLERLIKLDQNKLTFERKPGTHESLWDSWNDHDSDGFDRWLNDRTPKSYRLGVDEYDSLYRAVLENPEQAAAILEEQGFTASDLTYGR